MMLATTTATTTSRGVPGRGPGAAGRRSCACGAKRRTEQGRRRNKWTPGFGLATCNTVVIDGANVCWAFGREKARDLADADAVPDIEGLRVVLEQPLWEALSLEPVIFLPTTVSTSNPHPPSLPPLLLSFKLAG